MKRGLAVTLALILGFSILLLAGASAFSAPAPVCAKNDATLYKGRGTRTGLSWKVSRHMPFIRTEFKKGWAKVQDLEGVTHWARMSDLTRSTSCVVVKGNVAHFRIGPSTSAGLNDLNTLDRYTPLKKLGTKRDWVQVEDETGRRGWIHESQIWKPVIINSFSF
ncbi:MAG: SH3 domain-containing protein [Bdellovibrionales bacterium]